MRGWKWKIQFCQKLSFQNVLLKGLFRFGTLYNKRSVLTWTILIHIHSEKGNVTRSKMPDMKEMSPAMRPSHSCALSSVSQRLFGLSSMIGDNWLSKCPSFMALTAIKKKRNGFRQNGKMQYDWRLKLRGTKQMVLCGFSWYSSSLKFETNFSKFFLD